MYLLLDNARVKSLVVCDMNDAFVMLKLKSCENLALTKSYEINSKNILIDAFTSTYSSQAKFSSNSATA